MEVLTEEEIKRRKLMITSIKQTEKCFACKDSDIQPAQYCITETGSCLRRRKDEIIRRDNYNETN